MLPTRGSSFADADGIVVQVELSPGLLENPKMQEAEPLQKELERREKNAKSITNATTEVDGRSFFEIASWAGNLSDAKPKKQRLCQHFIIEDEIIGIFEQRQRQQDFAAERAIPGVVFRKLGAEQHVFKRGEQAIRYVLVQRHAAAKGAATEDS